MSDSRKDPPGGPPKDWKRWLGDLRVAIADHEAVTKDLLRRKRKRDLGLREAKRLYKDATDKIARLLAATDEGGGDDGDQERGDPAGLGGSPAH